MTEGKKIFFADLDGTLLTSEKVVSKATLEAVHGFVAAGNIFTISTGRPLLSALRFKDKLGLDVDDMYVAANNGAQIYSCKEEKTVFKTGIDIEDVPVFFKVAEEAGFPLVAYTDTHIITNKDSESIKTYSGYVGMPYIVAEDVVSKLEGPPCKTLAIELNDGSRFKILREKFTETFGTKYRYSHSDPKFFESIPPDAGKGKAIARLCQILGVPEENSIAAGDAENDLDMIEAAAVGIAMKNACEECKSVANIITEEDNDHDGLVKYIKQFT